MEYILFCKISDLNIKFLWLKVHGTLKFLESTEKGWETLI